jgi:hypothetical protein
VSIAAIALPSAKRRTAGSAAVSAPSRQTGWLKRLTVAIETRMPAALSARSKLETMRSRSAAGVPNGIRSSSWKLTPQAPTSASRATTTSGAIGGRVGSPNGSWPRWPTVHSPKLKRSSGVGA